MPGALAFRQPLQTILQALPVSGPVSGANDHGDFQPLGGVRGTERS
jgi:hypothetical protein